MELPYQDELSGEAVVFAPVQVQEGVLSFSCSKLHQTAEGSLLQPQGDNRVNHSGSSCAASPFQSWLHQSCTGWILSLKLRSQKLIIMRPAGVACLWAASSSFHSLRFGDARGPEAPAAFPHSCCNGVS